MKEIVSKAYILSFVKHAIVSVLIVYVTLTIIANLSSSDVISFPLQDSKACTWSKESFWSYPWAESQVHKGIDLFAKRNAKVVSPVNGIILEKGFSNNGGNFIYIIGTNGRIYYFAHLESIAFDTGTFVRQKQLLGYVGDSGNAKYSPCHLHFSISSLVPIFKRYDSNVPYGWKKMFYLNPSELWVI